MLEVREVNSMVKRVLIKIVKIAVCVAGALGATLASFYFMHMLISVNMQSVPSQEVHLAASLDVPEPSFDRRDTRKRPEKVLATRPPETTNEFALSVKRDVAIGEVVRLESTAEHVDFAAPRVEFVPYFDDLVATKIVQPVYPPKAKARQIEGHVVVEFSVQEDGRVQNPYVVESKPEQVFDKAALRAIREFRFKPAVVDDTVLLVDAVIRFGFQLKDSSEVSIGDHYR